MASRGGAAAYVTEIGDTVDHDKRRGGGIGGVHGGQRRLLLIKIHGACVV